jgi:hypothetical protein
MGILNTRNKKVRTIALPRNLDIISGAQAVRPTATPARSARRVAQPGLARTVRDREVAGSNPASPTTQLILPHADPLPHPNPLRKQGGEG